MSGINLKYVYALRALLCFIIFLVVFRVYPLPDFELYSNSEMELGEIEALNRTALTKNIFSYVSILFFNNIIFTNLFFIILTNLFFYLIHNKFKNFFGIGGIFIVFSSPSIIVWTSIYSKEMLFLITILVNIFILTTNMKVVLKIISICIALLFIALLRVQYLPFFILLHLVLIVNRQYFSFFLGAGGALTLILVLFLMSNYVPDVMELMSGYFLIVEGNSNRSWLPWSEVADFYKAIPLGIYTSIFKFTIGEMISKPISSVFFLEGILFVFVYLNCCRFVKWDKIFVITIIAICSLVINFPLNIFNPGSAMRYSSTTIILIFTSFLFLTVKRNGSKLSSHR